MVVTKTSGTVDVSGTNFSILQIIADRKVLLGYSPDQVRFWTMYLSALKYLWRRFTWFLTYFNRNLDWYRKRSHFFYLLWGSGRDKKSHIPFLIIWSQHWYLKDLIEVSGFPSLEIPLNLTYPEDLEHIISIFLFFLRDLGRNWPLWISPRQFLNYSLYWSPSTIQSFFSLDQVKELILESGSVTYQGTIDPICSFYNPPQSGPSTLTLVPFISSDHL